MVPFGGGTSVVGGVEPLGDGFAGVVSLDLRGLDGVAVDRVSGTATLAAGLLGPEAERRLASEGVTLGHTPQSFEYSTVGGWVATRSAGQASTGYGRIDELVEGVRLVAPAGELSAAAFPASAAGPDLRELVVGSEGVLGVISEATLRVRPVPALRHYEGWSFRSFAEGCAAFRALEQGDASPDVARLSDEEETRLSLALASSGSALERAGPQLPAPARPRGRLPGDRRLRGRPGRAWSAASRAPADLLRAGGGLRLGRRPGEAWRRGRFAGPYLRDELLDRGVMAETLETATGWSNLERLYEAVGARAALGAGRARHAGARDVPRVAPVSLRGLAATSPSWPARRARRRSSSGARPSRRPATRSWPTAARSPTTTPWAATTRPGCAPRWGSWGWS